ncbi:MAG: TrkH family potassium uptake protein [Firmicutes bacterium]|nr:TrkH family potassium uptake protein [Bacillota bacterium]
MNTKFVFRTIGQLLGVETVLMIPAILVAIYDRETDVASAFAWAMSLQLFTSYTMQYFCKEDSHKKYYAQEGFVTVSIGWIILSLFGCLPFWISGQIPSFIDALFEMVSGFTTTGATILSDIDSISRALLFWRSFSHWIGGMGMLVFILAIIPAGQGRGYTLHLIRAEIPGPDIGKLTPRMGNTAKILYGIYILLTILCAVMYFLAGMPLFESFCYAFGTAGTGGFSVHNANMALYTPTIQWIATVFMLLFGVNFTMFYFLLIREFKMIYKDEELRLYLLIVVAATLVITWNISPLYDSLRESFRHAAFHVSSITTTTAFATTNFESWPTLSQAILLCLMILGSNAGSTGGGIKTARFLLMLKGLQRNIRQALNPSNVYVILVNKRPIAEKTMQNLNAYMAAYWLLIIFSFLLVSIDGYSVTTSLSAVVACFNNIGMGLEMVGPAGNYAAFSDFSKLVFIADMLLGRLEIFPILVLFNPSTWNRFF